MARKKAQPSLIKQLDDSELFAEADFIKDAYIDVDDFNEEIVRQPEMHYHYGKLHSFAKKAKAVAELRVDLAKREVQTALSASHERIRKERTEAHEKVTESLLENESRLSSEYNDSLKVYADCKEAQVNAEFEAALLEVGERVFSKRTELLKTLGHLLGKEFDSGMSISKASTAKETSADFSSRLQSEINAAKEVMKKNREGKK